MLNSRGNLGGGVLRRSELHPTYFFHFANMAIVLFTFVSRRNLIAVVLVSLVLGGCAYETISPPTPVVAGSSDYFIGPGDVLQVYVWRNPEVSISVPVRPDGKISTPLVEDMVAVGKTPAQLARDIEKRLATYLKDPTVTIIVTSFVGALQQQIRVIGAAARPQALPYRANMTVLDVILAVGGLTETASGNRARIVRVVDGERIQFEVRLDDLIQDGDITANVDIYPGDILVIPASWF
jgi:polysaccharide export outer membrane protein